MPVFLSPPDPSAFDTLVWEIVRQIPAGKVASYGQIARFIPPPRGMKPHDYDACAPRWVGGAMAACPPDVPWQRVINAQGKISLRRGAERQRQLLEAEGITFDERERVDMKTYGWNGPSAQWLQEHGLIPPATPRQSTLLGF